MTISLVLEKNRGTRETILTLRLIIEDRLKENKDTYMAFIGFEKAFDNVKWHKLFEVLRKIGLNYIDRRILYNLYKKQVAGGYNKSRISGNGSINKERS